MPTKLFIIAIMFLGLPLVGCGSKPPPMTQSGFLSDYDNLEEQSNGSLRFASEDLQRYQSFMVDTIEIRFEDKDGILTDDQRAALIDYLHAAAVAMLIDHDKTIVSGPGPDIGRVRVALTEVRKSKWLLKLHPGMKIVGAGRGGASMEGEILDSLTGQQLAATIQANRGAQFELDIFNSLDDVRNVIDRWAAQAGKMLDDIEPQE